jgi:starch synthase
MNIILASAELTPLAKEGGLADIASSLPIEWLKYGQNPVVILPKYRHIDTETYGFKPTDLVLYVPISHWTEFARLWYGVIPGTGVPVYLIENNDYFNRARIYGEPDEYPDNDRRFIFFSRAVFEAARALNIYPDVIHAHDFHTAFTMAFLKTHYRSDMQFSKTAGVFSIHNLAYQGWFDPARALDFAQIGFDQFYPGSWFEHYGKVNAMKTGIMFADKITTVSPTYAKEIRIPYYSEGMQDVLNYRGADLIGVLNGVYYDEWSPEKDKFIEFNYDANNLSLKRQNKYALLRRFNVDPNTYDMPLVGMVTRLAEQKGIDLLINKLEYYLESNTFRFILLGSGEPRYEDYFRHIAWKYPGRALINIGYDNAISHGIIAGSDFLLMPSRYEPCGLTQMYALRYGTIPVVRQTGGLADTVMEYDYTSGKGYGFHFFNYNADDFAYALRRALSIYNSEPHWDIIRRNAMHKEYNSSNTALEYLKVFKWAIEKVRR